MSKAKVTVYNCEGSAVEEITLPAVFELPVNRMLLHRYVTWVRSVIRPTISNTKTRGEVSGGGRKPWRQKGTGRARTGSTRSPIWRKGGTVFGPLTARNWATRLPRTERRKAFLTAFSAKAHDNQLVVLDTLPIDQPRTKDFLGILDKVTPLQGKKVLHLHPTYEDTIFKATHNIPTVTSKTLSYVNVLDVLNHDVLLVTKDTLGQLERRFSVQS
jgi:large subunit ribosomal protein L4